MLRLKIKKKEAKYELFKGKDGLWYFRLVAPNGKIISNGEGYTTKRKCKHGIKANKKYAANAKVVELK